MIAFGLTADATCRPIEQTAIKNGQTYTDTVTLSRAVDGSDLKPATI